MPPYKNASKITSKSFLSSVWAEIKKPTIIFFPLLVFYKIISVMQVLSLMLEIPMNFFNHTEGEWRIMSITRAFIFFKKFDFQSNDPVTGTVFNISWIIILMAYLILMIVVISAKLQISRFNGLSKALNQLMIVHQFVLFLPIHVLMLQIIDTSSDYNINLLNSTNNSLFFALAILILALNFVIGALNLHCYSTLYVPKTFTKRNAYLATLDLIFKTIMSIYITFFTSTAYTKWIAIAIIIIYAGISFYIFHSQYPFFQIKLLEAYCYLLGAKLAMTLSITIVAIFDEFRVVSVPDLPAAAFIFCLPFCIKGQRYQMIKTFMNAIVFDEKSYKIECDVFTHMLALRFLFKKGADMSIKLSKKDATNWNMQLNGVLIRHNDTCTEMSCGCRTFLETEETFKGIGTKREKYKELKIILMRDLYEKGIEKVPHSELILLNLAQFYLLYLENYLRSYLVLQAFEKRANKSLVTDVLIEYLKKRIQERMELKLSGNSVQSLIGDYESTGLNVTALVQNEILFIQLKKLVHEQVLKQLKFWDLLDNFELSTKSIEVCCDEIDVQRNKIEKLWDNLSKINHKCSSHYLLYGLYQTLINNTTKQGERFLNDYCRMSGVGIQEKDGITNDNLYDPQTVIIRISMRRDKIGMIEESSGELETVFGYQPSDIIDTNVATLMSAFFKERHHNFVMNHFEKGTENALNKLKRLFGYHRDGHIFPMFLYVSIYPNIEANLSYMGIIRPRKVYNNYILLKSDGTVDSYSPEIAEYLGLESRKRYNISEICPEFEKINNAFNYVTRNKYNDLKDDIVEFKGEYNGRKINEYQVKVSGSSSGAPNYLEDPLQGSKKEFATLTTDREDIPGSMLGVTVETKDEVALAKSKEKLTQQTKALNKFKAPPAKKIRRLNTEDIDEYKKVYDQMAISGSVLTFVSQKEKTGGSVKNFLCTVSDEIFDFSILRIITLGRNDENVEVEKETERTGRTAQFTKTKGNSDEKEMLLNFESDDKGISTMPNFGELQLYKNPFDKPEDEVASRRGSELLVKSNNKEIVFRTIKTNPDTNSTSRNGLQEAKDRGLNKVISSANSQKRSSDYDIFENGKIEANFQDKDFIQEMLHTTDMDRIGANNSLAGSMKGGIISKFEALLYKKEEGKVSNKFRAYFFIITVCFVLSILNITITNGSLSRGSEKLQNLIFVGDRINNILRLNYNCRVLYLHLHNYIDIDRHLGDQGIVNYPQYALTSVKTNARDLLSLNNAVMNDIYDLHSESQPKFYSTTVQLKYPTTNMQEHNVDALDSFEAVDTIALAALEISSVDLASLATVQDEIQYILLNSMNQLYQEMRNGFTIYQSDLEKTLSGTRTATWGIAIAVLVTYVLFLFILFRDLTTTHQDKIRFWNSLIKLDTVKNISHKRFLVVFKENFENSWNNEMLKKALIESKQTELRESKAKKAKENQATGFKKLKSYKFKNRSYFIVFPFLIVLCVVLAFFIITGVRVTNEMENKRLYLQEITEAESYYELNLLTLNGLYEYISEKNTTVLLEQPVEQAVEDSLASLSELANFVATFKVRPDFDPRTYIQMNFCDTYLTEEEKLDCAKVGQGLNTQGLSAVLTFSKETMTSALDFAQHSPQDYITIKTAFDRSALITLETELKYISDGFELLVQSLADHEFQEQSDFWATQIVILVVFIIVMVLLNYMMVWNGFKRLDGQKFDNMRILRVIPTSMILESKMLTTYLLKSFKDDLSSMANKL